MNLLNIVHKLKSNVIVRLICYPAIYCLKLWRKFSFPIINRDDFQQILSFKDKYKGKRCFIVGNGPSLTVKDLDKIKNEYTFAFNRIYNVFTKTNWCPSFYMAMDSDFIKEESKTIFHLNLQYKFLDKRAVAKVALKCIAQKKNNIILFNGNGKFTLSYRTPKKIVFSTNCHKWVGSGYTVTYTALQFAIYMGFTEIYLLGIDHTYNKVIDSKGRIITNDGVQNHFFKDLKHHTIGYQYLEGTTFAYQLAKEYADTHGIKIYNATRGGKLEVFERIDFDSLFEKNTETEMESKDS